MKDKSGYGWVALVAFTLGYGYAAAWSGIGLRGSGEPSRGSARSPAMALAQGDVIPEARVEQPIEVVVGYPITRE